MGSQDLSVLDGLDTNAAELRAALAAFQPGVFGAGDFKVTPRGAGANRSIDLAGGRAVIGSPIGTMPTYMGPNYLVGETAVINSDAFELGGIAPPHPTYARMDQIVLRLYDNEGGLKKWRPEIIQGQTPTANATLDLRQSASNLPAGVPVMRVADVIVPTTGIITATEIRDRRPWARGFNGRYFRKSAPDYSTISTSWAGIDDANMSLRCELGTGEIEVVLRGFADDPTGQLVFALFGPTGGSAFVEQYIGTTAPTQTSGEVFSWRGTLADLGLTPGSQVFRPAWRVSAGTGKLYSADNTAPAVQRHVIWSVTEHIRQSATN